MTLVLKNDEKIEHDVEVKTPYGKGRFYVTNHSMIVEINKKGIVFERMHIQIAVVEAASENKIKVTWPEGRHLFDFEFKLKNAQDIVKAIVENHNYDNNFPDLMGANTVIISDKEQKKIIEKRTEAATKSINMFKKTLDEANLNLNMIKSDDPDKKQKILEAAQKTSRLQNRVIMWENYQKDIPSVVMNRLKKVPKEIPNYRVWNDCWYDEKSDCFVTFNDYWNNQDWLKELKDVKEFESKNKIPNVYAIPMRCVWFLYGYPILSTEISESIGMIRTFLPTMTDDMITDDMISKKFGIEMKTEGEGLPPNQTKPSVTYKMSEGSRLVLKNGKKYDLTRKETLFFLNRNMITQEDKLLLP